MVDEKTLERAPDAEIDCLRCGTRMKATGPMQLYEGALPVLIETIAISNLKRVEFDTCICPNCGKVELFF